MKTVAVLTPTYNRAHTLATLYHSLLNQTSKDFKWYVIDDGSVDDTEEKIASFLNGEVEIEYIKKQNGGKHTAINVGLNHIEEELTFIVDSDDYLTADAIETILTDWKEYRHDPMIGGLSYYRIYDNGNIIGKAYPSDDVIIDTYANIRINQNVSGDKAEIYRTDVLKTHLFPEFPGEKFLSEAVVWNAIARDGYKLVFLAKGIYCCEYLPGGLTALGRKYRLQNPYGTMEHAKSFLYDGVRPIYRLKYMLLYTATRPFSKMTVKEALVCLENYKLSYLVCFFPGLLLAAYWKKKYKM